MNMENVVSTKERTRKSIGHYLYVTIHYYRRGDYFNDLVLRIFTWEHTYAHRFSQVVVVFRLCPPSG